MIYHDIIVIVPIGTQWSLSPYVPKFHWRILPSKVFKVSCFMFLAASGVPCLLPSTQHCSESQVRAKRRCWTGKMLLMLAGPTETMAESCKHCRNCLAQSSLSSVQEFTSILHAIPESNPSTLIHRTENWTLCQQHPWVSPAPGVLLLWWPLPLAPQHGALHLASMSIGPSVL